MSQGSPAAYGQQPPSSGLSIASMVLGIVSVVIFCIWYISVPCAIVAIVLGFVARGRVKAGTGAGGGMAMAGLICGIISIVLVVLVFAGLLAFLGLGGTKMIEDLQQEIQKQQQQQQQGVPNPGMPGQGMLNNPPLVQPALLAVIPDNSGVTFYGRCDDIART